MNEAPIYALLKINSKLNIMSQYKLLRLPCLFLIIIISLNISSCSDDNGIDADTFNQVDYLTVNDDYQELSVDLIEDLNVSCYAGENPLFQNFGEDLFVVQIRWDKELLIGPIYLSPVVQISFFGGRPEEGEYSLMNYYSYWNGEKQVNNLNDFGQKDAAFFIEYFDSNLIGCGEFFANEGSLVVKNINNDISVVFKGLEFKLWRHPEQENECPIIMEGKISCR